MSGYGSYPDHVKTRPIISYDVGRGTQTYVTRIETHVQEVRRPTVDTKYANTSLKVDPSKESRPREVDEFITQAHDEVNGPPNWGRHGDPVKVEPKRDYGLDYKYGGPPIKSEEVSRDYGDPYRQRGGSSGHPPHRDYSVPRDDYRAPDNQPHKEYSVPNNQWNNNKPKATRGTYDEPKGNNKPVSYPSDPYTHYGSGNVVNPKGYQTTNNIGKAMEKQQVSAGGTAAGRSSAPTTVTGPRPGFSVPGPVGPKRVSVAGPLVIDSRETSNGYGDHNLPLRPYTGKEDQKKTITCKEAREKYNGSFVPN